VCDDGNLISGDGCEADCSLPASSGVNPAPIPPSICGNGALEANESCDDGNHVDGDGCEADCRLPACGNGIEDFGEICLSPGQNFFELGTNPGAVALVDFDLDGKLDLLLTDLAENKLRIRPGDGNGNFTPRSTLDVGQNPGAMTVGDFNGNGRPDIAVANAGSGNVTVYFNVADQSLSVRTLPTGDHPVAIAALDLDGNGKIDLVTANSASNDVTVLWDFGQTPGQVASSTFSAAPDGNGLSALSLGDLTGDGKPDIVVSGSISNKIVVLENRGSRNFLNTLSFVLGNGDAPNGIVTTDTDNDGDLDLLALAPGNDKLVSFRNDGNRQFVSRGSFPAGENPQAIVSVDFDLDGKTDLAVGNQSEKTLAVLRGNGNGTFAPLLPFKSVKQPRALAVGKLDGDSHPDLVAIDGSQVSAFVHVLTWLP
ncbi:MAG: FG-GAP-like repeat-containing protein, partial [Deltaproteobacteria bacterium]|nr:FG-GAP-like repeat-containing protein [Deltaproteobacteria bacterium]